MLDLNKIIGLVFSFKRKNNLKEVKKRIIEIATSFDKDDLIIVGDQIAKGSGEITSVIANFVDYNPIIALRDSVKTMGLLDCMCPKSVIIIGDYFDEDFAFHLKKMIKLSLVSNYEIDFLILDMSNKFNFEIKKITIDEMIEILRNSQCQI